MFRRVVLGLCLWCRAAGSTLINQDNPVMVGVKKPSISWCRPCARAAVEKDNRHTFFIPALFPVKTVHLISTQKARLAALYCGIEWVRILLLAAARGPDGFKCRNVSLSMNTFWRSVWSCSRHHVRSLPNRCKGRLPKVRVVQIAFNELKQRLRMLFRRNR